MHSLAEAKAMQNDIVIPFSKFMQLFDVCSAQIVVCWHEFLFPSHAMQPLNIYIYILKFNSNSFAMKKIHHAMHIAQFQTLLL